MATYGTAQIIALLRHQRPVVLFLPWGNQFLVVSDFHPILGRAENHVAKGVGFLALFVIEKWNYSIERFSHMVYPVLVSLWVLCGPCCSLTLGRSKYWPFEGPRALQGEFRVYY
jgi:hypothetical protein